jgi:SWI/SNF-related matrix-associated actin-dependent regulator of chromatin subfamily A3
MMCRLRQFCDDPSLVPNTFIESLKSDAVQTYASLNSEKLESLIEAAIANDETCAICLDPIQLSKVGFAKCLHFFCFECLKSSSCCPICGDHVQLNDIRRATEYKKEESVSSIGISGARDPSPKLIRLIQLVKETPPGIKSVIFSQWTSMLEIVGNELQKNRISYTLFTGQLSRVKRDEALMEFKSYNGTNVLLISLKCGSVGLNIIEASQVFLMDPWWNTSIEQQAIDRVHRIGQMKTVNVFKFVMKNSVEDRVLYIQNSKNDLIKNVFSNIKGANSLASNSKKLQEIAFLFGLDNNADYAKQ